MPPRSTSHASLGTRRSTRTSASSANPTPESSLAKKRGRAVSTATSSTTPPDSGLETEFPPTPNSMSSASPSKRRRGVKEEHDVDIDTAAFDRQSTPPPRKVKKEDSEEAAALASPEKTPKGKQTTSERKLASYKASIAGSPFPDHPLPTAEEAERVAWILGDFHGYKREEEGGRGLPQYTTPKGDNKWGGCGDVASVLEAVIRTVLSCNTSNKNSAAAHKSLSEHFGKQNWQAIHKAPESELVEAIRCGGLANNKAKTIKGILSQTFERHGKLSLDHLHEATDDEIMQELVSFNGVGPKVASCVSAFCIGRQSMAVDTHVFRLCKMLGWVPEKANRDQTYYHLHERVPGHLKYPLHVLLIKHGKMCSNCSAKGFATVKEELSASENDDEDTKDIRKANKERPCPLKANGLLGRKVKALKDAAAGSTTAAKAKVKSEVKEEDMDADADVKPAKASASTKNRVKSEKNEEAAGSASEDQIDFAAALTKAQEASPAELLKILQKARNTRSKNPIDETLKKNKFSLELMTGSELSSEQRKRVFAIFEDNMKAMYRNSTLGWKPTEKKRELFSSDSRFVVIRPAPEHGAEVAGFAMFRFDTESSAGPPEDPTAKQGETEVEVAYLYEIQIKSQHQRDGLGRELMQVIFTLAQQTQMRKVMLTVFDENKNARAFYDRQGYTVDPVSPSQDPKRKNSVDFEIMYKPTGVI
ncbi:DNA glycosylase [Testicularia cyperi]|uniref:DNA glycosylase n=1 Tax=Testicularia cyperi TaxID=1882483 RepID=A0A317XWX2_9BASI|nr:DNA glycosylase [Testicularia cyperi]